MNSDHLELRSLSEEEVEEIQRLQQIAHETAVSNQVGSSEHLESRIDGEVASQTLRNTQHGYVEQDGTLIKQTVDSSRFLACRCPGLIAENTRVCSNSGEVICAMHTVQCDFCHQNVWSAYANIAGEKIVCKKCKKRRRITMPFSAIKTMVLTVVYGLGGQEWEEVDISMPLGKSRRIHREQAPNQETLGRGVGANGAHRIR